MLEVKRDGQRIHFHGSLNRDTVPAHWPFTLLQGVTGQIDFDFTDIVHVDTAGLAWILQQQARAKQQDLQIRLCGVTSQLLSLAEVSDVLPLLSIES